MTSAHHPTDTPTDITQPTPSRAAQCLRHHKWMAACTDCRDARGTDRPRAAASR